MAQKYFSTGNQKSMVKNYDRNFIERAVVAMTGTSSVHSVGLAQEMHNNAGEDREDEDVGKSEVPNDDTVDFGEQTNMSFLEW